MCTSPVRSRPNEKSCLHQHLRQIDSDKHMKKLSTKQDIHFLKEGKTEEKSKILAQKTEFDKNKTRVVKEVYRSVPLPR